MRIFAIGDLHLPGGDEKPMEVFGDHWEGHFSRICQDWQNRVGEEDVVLIPGDISWAMQLQDALPDLNAIGALPGRKLLIKGNHDYWWTGIGKVRRVLPEGMQAIQHDTVDIGAAVVCGTRGWAYPTAEAPLSSEDERIFNREMIRLELALQSAVLQAQGRPVLVMLHYPPLYNTDRDTPFTRLLEQYAVHTVICGHLHGAGVRAGFNGVHRGVRYLLASCDSLGFALVEVDLETKDITKT